MTWSAAKTCFAALQDADEDRNVEIATTAVRLGVSGMILWSGAWWLASTVCSALVSPLVAVVSRRSLAGP